MPKSYLFLRLTALGDIVFALEALASLRASDPEARVDWLVEDRWAPFLSAVPGIREVLVYPRRALSRCLARPWLWPSLLLHLIRHLRRLRSRRYDCALDLQGNLKSGVQLFLLRAKRRIVFDAPRAREGSQRFGNERVPVPRQRWHRTQEGLALVRQAIDPSTNRRGDSPEAPRCAQTKKLIHVADEERERVREEFLGSASDHKRLIVLAPGTSSFARFKRWPAEKFRALAELLAHEGKGVVISAGPGERELAEQANPGNPVRIFDGSERGPGDFLSLLAAADCLVAADSAPLHLAQAVGTPVVALFGPKDEAVYGPWRGVHRVLRHEVPCAPCGRRDCDAPLCVRGILPKEARDACLSVLAEVEASGP